MKDAIKLVENFKKQNTQFFSAYRNEAKKRSAATRTK
jgi:hypothetical protein